TGAIRDRCRVLALRPGALVRRSGHALAVDCTNPDARSHHWRLGLSIVDDPVDFSVAVITCHPAHLRGAGTIPLAASRAAFESPLPAFLEEVELQRAARVRGDYLFVQFYAQAGCLR